MLIPSGKGGVGNDRTVSLDGTNKHLYITLRGTDDHRNQVACHACLLTSDTQYLRGAITWSFRDAPLDNTLLLKIKDAQEQCMKILQK